MHEQNIVQKQEYPKMQCKHSLICIFPSEGLCLCMCESNMYASVTQPVPFIPWVPGDTAIRHGLWPDGYRGTEREGGRKEPERRERLTCSQRLMEPHGIMTVLVYWVVTNTCIDSCPHIHTHAYTHSAHTVFGSWLFLSCVSFALLLLLYTSH